LVLVMYTITVGYSTTAWVYSRVTRNGTAIGVATNTGSRRAVGGGIIVNGATDAQNLSQTFVDAPASTSALTYQVEMANQSAGTSYINRTGTDTDSSSFQRMHSSIFVCEIPA